MEEYRVTVNSDYTKWYNSKNELHRLDGPAIEWVDGSKEWWYNGNLHRLEGPAAEYKNGQKEWYIGGIKYTEEEFLAKTQKHTIVIDGKEIELSQESYEVLKQSLTQGEVKDG